MFASSKSVLHISHSEDDLFLTRFTLDEVQTLEIEDFYKDFIAMPFDQHNNIVVLGMMKAMSFLPGMRLRRCQHGPSEFIVSIYHDTHHSDLGSFLLRLIIDTWCESTRRR